MRLKRVYVYFSEEMLERVDAFAKSVVEPEEGCEAEPVSRSMAVRMLVSDALHGLGSLYRTEKKAARMEKVKTKDGLTRPRPSPPHDYFVVVQEWEESERGWGVRPDGYTMHASKEARDAYVKDFISRQPDGPAPDEYTRMRGEPYMVKVDRVLYEKVRTSGKACWGVGTQPPASWSTTRVALKR